MLIRWGSTAETKYSRLSHSKTRQIPIIKRMILSGELRYKWKKTDVKRRRIWKKGKIKYWHLEIWAIWVTSQQVHSPKNTIWMMQTRTAFHKKRLYLNLLMTSCLLWYNFPLSQSRKKSREVSYSHKKEADWWIISYLRKTSIKSRKKSLSKKKSKSPIDTLLI